MPASGSRGIPETRQSPARWIGTTSAFFDFSPRDADGLNRSQYFTAPDFTRSGLDIGIRRTDATGDSVTVAFRTTGAAMLLASGVYRVPVSRVSADDLGDVSTIVPPVGTDYRVRLMAPISLEIPDSSIIGAKIADDTIGEDHMMANSITADKIAAGSITAGKIAAGAITAGKIARQRRYGWHGCRWRDHGRQDCRWRDPRRP